MTTRKKWRIVYPSTTDAFTSEAELNRFVDGLRDGWVAGGSVSAVTVQVDEGSGWQPFEHINFAEEAS